MRFQYVPFGADAPSGAAACDGLVPGSSLDLSHWPRNSTPRHLKADTSVEIALTFAREREKHDVAIAANNHFDADGVLAVWTLLRPELALEHERLIVAAAEHGDFDVWPSDDRGIWLEAAIGAIGAGKSDREAYQVVLAALDDLVPRIEQQEHYWAKSYQTLLAYQSQIDRGAVTVEREGRITIVTHHKGAGEIPGAWISRLADPNSDRWLLAFEEQSGFRYRYELPRWSWADTVSRPQIATPRRGPIKQLGAEWIIKGRLGMTGVAYTKKPIPSRPQAVAKALADLEN